MVCTRFQSSFSVSPSRYTGIPKARPEEIDAEQTEPDDAAEAVDDVAPESPEQEEAAPSMKVEKFMPPAEHYTLRVGEHDDKVYATRGDGIIFQVESKLLDLLRAEQHEPAILQFEQSQVISVTVTEPDGTTHTFSKLDDQWQYTPEPDLPIDAKKITDLLLRIADLKTERYVFYGTVDLPAFGLDTPWRSPRPMCSASAQERAS